MDWTTNLKSAVPCFISTQASGVGSILVSFKVVIHRKRARQLGPRMKNGGLGLGYKVSGATAAIIRTSSSTFPMDVYPLSNAPEAPTTHVKAEPLGRECTSACMAKTGTTYGFLRHLRTRFAEPTGACSLCEPVGGFLILRRFYRPP